MFGLELTVAVLLLGQVPLPGTQPNELILGPEPSSTCGCHEAYTLGEIIEPGRSYRATLMAQAGRDPVFRAAFRVAREDRPNLSELCLRCHTPAAWLNGRSGGGLEDLIPEDLESVTCDVCHRMVPTDPPLIGSGQYTIAPSTAKRARRGSPPPPGGHQTQRSEYIGSAEACGVCHSLFNPAERAHDEHGRDLGFHYYEQRTYEEWKDSVFSQREGTSCIHCHMKTARGARVRGGDEYEDLAVHSFVGGNDFAVRAVRLLNPNLPIAAEVAQVVRWVDETLRAAAELELLDAPSRLELRGGEPMELAVRLTNKTGHKLPTGYPEGRRVYLEVSLQLEGREREVLSGAWDAQTGDLIPDPQLRTYETAHGRVEDGVSTRTHSLILMNQILLDTRIPPEGFRPHAADMVPIGRDYGASAPYRHFDEHAYSFTAPDVPRTVTGTVTVRAMYQVIDGEVVRYLVDATRGTQESTDLQRAWEMLGRAPPKEMAAVRLPVTVAPRPPTPDAGVTEDGGMPPPVTPDPGGCGCRSERGGSGPWALLLFLPLAWRLRPRAQRRCR